MIEIIIIALVLFIIKDLLSQIFQFLWEHIIPILAVVAFLAILAWGGWDVVITLLIFGLVIFGVSKLISALYRTIQVRLQKSHRDQLKEWLAANATRLSQVSTDDMLTPGKQVSLPEHFIHYSYPPAEPCRLIVENFLWECDRKLQNKIPEALYQIVRNAGMIEEREVEGRLAWEYGAYTRCRSIQDMCTTATRSLESAHKLDRPTDDKKVLHCVGVSGGTNFDSEELEIEI